jgi:hypothetical protein
MLLPGASAFRFLATAVATVCSICAGASTKSAAGGFRIAQATSDDPTRDLKAWEGARQADTIDASSMRG